MRKFIVAFACVLFLYALAPAQHSKDEKFAVYYTNKLPADRFTKYDLLILDSIHHPSLRSISENTPTILGYISLGEVAESSSYFSLFKKSNLLLTENENWKGSYGVDIRESLWQKTVIEELIPEILRSGFNGIFIDTLDTPLEMEKQDPKKYFGMADSAIQIIQAIRLNYPTIKIMVNRSYDILPKIASSIDMVLGESVNNTYNFESGKYEPVNEISYNNQVEWLKDAVSFNKSLKIYTLDYANKSDITKIADIYRIQRANGFIPYVTTIGLDELIAEPVIGGSVK
ncbi:MAG: hypothetical protein COV35_05885 [Alphaproteobacteria bacterium CG11_big_fil_rev_8_21_14_0_20_39_49]|nr:MAG: hypothetical protein COV35_05885 [Alphaproteobacteria bacterium CG11_big_fil_rev_8_21_14_0_20_39_49]